MARYSISFIIAIALNPALCTAAAGQDTKTADATRLLLSRLDLIRPELEKVRAAADDPARAAAELLVYYRARTAVKHPIDRQDRIKMKGAAPARKTPSMPTTP